MKFEVYASAIGTPGPMTILLEGWPFGLWQRAADIYIGIHLKKYTRIPGQGIWLGPRIRRFEAVDDAQEYGATIYVKEILWPYTKPIPM